MTLRFFINSNFNMSFLVILLIFFKTRWTHEDWMKHLIYFYFFNAATNIFVMILLSIKISLN